MSRLPIRLRLALGFAATLAVLLLALGTFVYEHHRADLDAAIEQGLVARAAELRGASGGPPHALAATRFTEPDETLEAILDSRGAVSDATPNVAPRALARVIDVSTARRGSISWEARLPRFDSPVRGIAYPLGNGRIGVVGTALADRNEALGSLRRELALAAPVAIVIAGLIAYAFAAAALRPVEAMRRRAELISAGNVDERLPAVRARDELARLGETLNSMIDRLCEAAARERRFAADASHELRTPLALLRTELELALDGEQPRGELVSALRSAADETERLIRLSEDLLLLARADDDQLALRLRPVDVGALLDRLAHRFRPLADDVGRCIEIRSPQGLELTADEATLERAVANLVANALQHGAGTITLEGVMAPPQVRVRDEGSEHEPPSDLFERFRRGPGAAPGGTGLGLAIVAAIASAHGGTAGTTTQHGGFEAWITLGTASPTGPGLVVGQPLERPKRS
jgi:two-component system OmpR family sensor kinase